MSVKFKISAKKKIEFKDLLEFIKGHVRAMLDPTFGDIQNLTKTNVNPKQQRASGKCRSSIATTVALMSEPKCEAKFRYKQKPKDMALESSCLFCPNDHTLETCEMFKHKLNN